MPKPSLYIVRGGFARTSLLLVASASPYHTYPPGHLSSYASVRGGSSRAGAPPLIVTRRPYIWNATLPIGGHGVQRSTLGVDLDAQYGVVASGASRVQSIEKR